MPDARKATLILLVFLVGGAVTCGAMAFAQALPDDLLPSFVIGWRLRASVLRFIDWFPALLISGVLIGYAISFGKSADSPVERWSPFLLASLKGAFAICFVGITVYVILSEGVGPVLSSRQAEFVARTKDYRDYLEVARQSMKTGDYATAEFQSSVACQIWPESAEATELREQCRYLRASASGGSSMEAPSSGLESLPPGAANLTVLSALDLAQEANARLDYYSAHYYAMLAYRLARDTDPNRDVALRVASAAWNSLSEGLAEEESAPDRELFATKKKGYDAIQRGDYLSAYYVFLGLREKELSDADGKADPDVSRFLDVSRQGLLDAFFFMDETGNMKRFETSRDVFFVVRRADGSSMALFARGVTWSRSTGKDLAYLRDFECVSLGWDGVVRFHVSVPYAKMFPFKSPEGKLVPEILLHAVDRGRPGVETLPTVLAGSLPEESQNVLVLDMPYGDFSLASDASGGVSGISLFELFRLEPLAANYGFSVAEVRCEIINRLADPFIVLIVSVYALVLGWRFRLSSKTLFKAWWALSLPLFPVFAVFFMDLARYVTRIGIVAIVRFVPYNPILPVLAALTAWFAGVSVFFFSQRSD